LSIFTNIQVWGEKPACEQRHTRTASGSLPGIVILWNDFIFNFKLVSIFNPERSFKAVEIENLEIRTSFDLDRSSIDLHPCKKVIIQ